MTTLPAGFFGAMFLAGLMGGLHCAGMCGGILSALSAGGGEGARARLLSMHLGRIGSYALLGALVGAVGGMGGLLARLLPVQTGFYVLANLLLLITGAYMLGWRRPMFVLEGWGGRLWRRVAPLTRPLGAGRSTLRSLALGGLWGFMPCGLVYGALAMALLSADALTGAVLMVAFGLGTLPNLLAAGALLRRGAHSAWRGRWQRLAGVLVTGFGVYGLAHATEIGAQLRSGLLCLAVN